jgi:hypothetical protein
MRGTWIHAASAVLACALAAGPALATERVEKALDLSQPVPRGGKLQIENLIGSLVVRADRTAGRAVASARVVVEAPTRAEAQAIADSFSLRATVEGGTTSILVDYPVDRFSAFKMPRGEKSGLFAKWVTPLVQKVQKTTVAASYGGRSVEVGPGSGALAVAVHMEVALPLDVDASVRQAVGTLQAVGVRGKFNLEVVEGEILAEQVYGRLETRTGGADVTVRNFSGQGIEMQTSSGRMAMVEVRADEARVRTGSGSVDGSGITTAALHVESATGGVRLADVDTVAFDVASGSGLVDLGLRITRTREASVRTDTGNVVLRVNPTTPFLLHAESTTGSVQHKDVAVEILEQDKRRMRLQRGQGGADLRVTSDRGDVFVRPS